MAETTDAEDVGRAIEALYDAFYWGDSAEGFEFWSDIDDRLQRIKASYEAGKKTEL